MIYFIYVCFYSNQGINLPSRKLKKSIVSVYTRFLLYTMLSKDDDLLLFLLFQMSLISLNFRNLLLVTLIIGSLALLFVALGPQGISPAIGMAANRNEQSFKNLNLRGTALPVPSYKGGESAPGVSIKIDNVNIMVKIAKQLVQICI